MKKICVIGLFVMLTACGPEAPPLTPMSEFPAFTSEGMDRSVLGQLQNMRAQLESSADASLSEQLNMWRDLAHALHSYDQFKAAEMAYLNALMLSPDDDRLVYQLGHLYRQHGEYELSNQRFNEVATRVNNYAPLFNNLAENQFDMGQLDAAENMIKKSLAIQSKEAYAMKIYADVLAAKQQEAAAIEQLEGALSLQPTATKLNFFLAQLYQSTGQTDKAAATRAKAGNGTVSTRDPWLSEVAKDIKGYNHAISMAEKALNQKQYDVALSWAEKAQSDRPEGFTTHMVLGVIKMRQNKVQAALDHFRTAYRVRPDDFKVNLNLGTVYKTQGDYGRAMDFYQKAIDLDADHLAAKINWADAACSNQQLDASMDMVYQLIPTDMAQPAYHLGIKCLIQHAEYARAYAWLQDNVAHVKNNHSFMDWGILLLVSAPDPANRNGNLALTWLQRLMANNNSAKRQQLLVLALLETRRFDAAAQQFQNIKTNNNSLIPYVSLKQLVEAKSPYRLTP